MTEFLLDENVLGLARYLDGKVKFKKIGDEDCPSKESPDPQVARFAKEHNLYRRIKVRDHSSEKPRVGYLIRTRLVLQRKVH